MPPQVFSRPACIVISLVVCALPMRGPTARVEARESSAQDVAPTREQVANATFSGIYKRPIQLVRGRYDGQPFVPGGASRPSVVWLEELYMVGDVGVDGVLDAVALLAESSGGSGSNVFVALLSVRDGHVVNHGTALVGDRVQIRMLEIVDGQVWLHLVQPGPEDTACCPTQLAKRAWGLQEGEFVETHNEVSGTLSLEAIAGIEWRLVALDFDEPVPTNPVATIVFKDGKLVGSGGCNEFFFKVHEDAPGLVTLGPIGSTYKTCDAATMNIETSYFARLGLVVRYSFLSGRLALTWEGQRVGTLLFVPASKQGSNSYEAPSRQGQKSP
jgi:heat shock protein HslJ